MIYISDNRKPERFLAACLDRLAESAAAAGAKLITITEKSVHRGDRRLLTTPHMPYDRIGGPPNRRPIWHGLFYSYLQGLSFCRDDDECYMADDDCLVPPDHFKLPCPWAMVGFNLEVTYLARKGFFELHATRGGANNCGCYGHAYDMRKAWSWKLDEIATPNGGGFCYEPAEGGPRPYKSTHSAKTSVPIVDIRIYNRTWTPPSDTVYRDEDPYWGKAAKLLKELEGQSARITSAIYAQYGKKAEKLEEFGLKPWRSGGKKGPRKKTT